MHRILHAGYIIESATQCFIFDPLFENPFSQNCYAFPDVKFDLQNIKKLKFTAIFISHYHDDHCSFQSLKLFDRQTPIYIYCLADELIQLLKELGFKSVYPLVLNKAVLFNDGLEIIPRKALDSDVDSIFQIKTPSLNILNLVDSWIDDDTLNLLCNENPWDLILWPFQTLREIEVLSPSQYPEADQELPVEWIEQIRLLNPKNIIPSSCQFKHEKWSWYNEALFPISYKKFTETMNNFFPHIQVLKLNPAEGLEINSQSVHKIENLKWVLPIGDQNVDYTFNPNSLPAKISEIAQHFPKLNVQQKNRIQNYCQLQIVEKMNSLKIWDEEYFNNDCIWKLIIYDQNGLATDYIYKINQQDIILLKDKPQSISWQTEISEFKLLSALEFGETLTSLYLRINDCPINPDQLKTINHVDLLSDPLIRCLFDNTPLFSYQKNQLAQIKLEQT